jgi:GNAT superfamily N-acetyltransferase
MITLRPATFSDYAAIAKLHAESWQQTYRGIFTDNFLDNHAEEERSKVWHDRLRHPVNNQLVTVAVQNEIIVAFSCLYLYDDPASGSLLDNLHVASSFQNSGVGKMLMKNCASQILAYCDSHKMYLWVFKLNQNARRIYEHLGGVNVMTEIKETMNGAGVKACKYVWDDVTVLL